MQEQEHRTAGHLPEPRPFAHPPSNRGGLYIAVADYLTTEINRGVYPPGSRLPSTIKLMDMCDVSDSTARGALKELEARGWAESRDRSGFYVRIQETYTDHDGQAHISGVNTGTAQSTRIARAHTPPTPQRLPAAAGSAPIQGLGPLQGLSPLHADRPAQAARPMQDVPMQSVLSPARATISSVQARAEMPAPDISSAMRLEDPNEPVIARHRILTDANGNPVELRSSYLPAALATGTDLTTSAPLEGAWLAIIAQCTGRTPASTRAYNYARPAEPSEAHALAIPGDTWVLVRDTTSYENPALDGPALDLTRSVWPADTTRIVFSQTVTV
jgi:DNA-binding GntR family transcriptional regulator